MEASQSLLLNAASHNPSTTQVTEEPQIAVKNGLEEKMKKNFSQIWIPVTLHVACCFDPWSVEDIQPDRWVEEAIRLLPDVMAFVSQVNASSIPTWESVDEYVESLVQQSFMGAWSALHRTNDVGNVTLTAYSGILRSQAVVSRTRAFFWLGGTLLLPVSAIIVTYFQRQYLDRASLSAVNSRAATLLSRLEADEDGVLHIRTPLLSSHSAVEEKGGLEA